MGTTSEPQMLFDLSSLVTTHGNLQHLSLPFSTLDIDKIVQHMPTDKVAGPDGFNGLFLKRCWHIIKEEVYCLCFDFFNGTLDLQAINSSFVTLIPKAENRQEQMTIGPSLSSTA